MRRKDKVMNSLIAEGQISSDLGLWLSENEVDGKEISSLLDAAIIATRNANREAQLLLQPLIVAESGSLYQVMPNGEKQFLKKLAGRPIRKRKKHFKLL